MNKYRLISLVVGFACGSMSPHLQAVEYFPSDTFLRPILASPSQIAHELPLSKFAVMEGLRVSSDAPFWGLAQWNCVQGLAPSNRVYATASATTWSNDLVAIQIETDSPGHSLVRLTTDSLAIYNREPMPYARMSHIRPHFLLSHNFYPDLGGVRVFQGKKVTAQDDSVLSNLNAYATLVMSCRLRLECAEDRHMNYRHESPAKYDVLFNRNCFQFWFRIYCRDHAAASYGKSFWLGYRVFDSVRPYKSPIPYRVAAIESDGEMQAYLAAPLELYGENYAETLTALQRGAEVPLVFDMLGLARKAVAALQQQKKLFLDAPPDLAGYTVSQFNIGWELAAPFYGVMTLRDLSLRGEWLAK